MKNKKIDIFNEPKICVHELKRLQEGKLDTREGKLIFVKFFFDKYYNSFSALNPAYEFSTLYEIETYIKKNHQFGNIIL